MEAWAIFLNEILYYKYNVTRKMSHKDVGANEIEEDEDKRERG